MRTVRKICSPTSDVGILLGKQGENKVTEVVFDLKWLINNCGNGTAVLVHKRNQDTAPYICTTSRNGSELLWVITNTDTAQDKWGEAEIRWMVNDALAKTITYKTMVTHSITEDTVFPDPYQSLYDEMIEQMGDIQQYAQDAAGSAQEAESAKEAVLGATVRIIATGDGNVTLEGVIVDGE